MEIRYDARKDLPFDKLHTLFQAVGWSDGTTTPAMLENFNVPFRNSTLVWSAWDGDTLAGCVRVLSDKMFRSVIYDLAVLPKYQGCGIGKELVRRCQAAFPGSEWLVGTETAAEFYERLGFRRSDDVFLTIPCKWFG